MQNIELLNAYIHMVESGELPEPTLPDYMRSVKIHFNSIALEWVRMEAEVASLRRAVADMTAAQKQRLMPQLLLAPV